MTPFFGVIRSVTVTVAAFWALERVIFRYTLVFMVAPTFFQTKQIFLKLFFNLKIFIFEFFFVLFSPFPLIFLSKNRN